MRNCCTLRQFFFILFYFILDGGLNFAVNLGIASAAVVTLLQTYKKDTSYAVTAAA